MFGVCPTLTPFYIGNSALPTKTGNFIRNSKQKIQSNSDLKIKLQNFGCWCYFEWEGNPYTFCILKTTRSSPVQYFAKLFE